MKLFHEKKEGQLIGSTIAAANEIFKDQISLGAVLNSISKSNEEQLEGEKFQRSEVSFNQSNNKRPLCQNSATVSPVTFRLPYGEVGKELRHVGKNGRARTPTKKRRHRP